jgi:hypothetical protein
VIHNVTDQCGINRMDERVTDNKLIRQKGEPLMNQRLDDKENAFG